MAYDGTLKFDTALDSKGFQHGIDTIGNIAQKGMQATGVILKGAMAAIGGIGAAAVKVGSDFESAMSKVQAISGAAGDDLKELTEKAKEMGSATKFSATESANAFEYMAMAGWKTADMLDGIEGIMNLAAASGEDLAVTSDIVTDALTAFGMSASDATDFADILAAASSNANTNVSMMGETFKYVAPVAGALGYTAKDTALAIGLMANAGIKGSQAGTTLRTMMSRLTKPTDEVRDAMDSLGISLTHESGKMKSMQELMVDLRDGFAGLSEAEAAQTASALAGQEAMSGLLAIVGASDDDFSKLQKSIYNCDGAAAQMAETMNDNLQGQLTILKSGLEGLGISLYENMQEPLKGIAEEAQVMVKQLQEAFNEGGFEELVGAVGDVLSRAVQQMAEAVPALIDAAVELVGSFCDGLKSASGMGEAGAGLITSLISGLMSCVGEIWTTAAVLAGKLAGGIADGAPQMIQAAASAVDDIIECVTDWLPDIMDAGVRIVQALTDGVADMLPDLAVRAVDLITEFALKLVESLPAITDCAIQLVQALIDGLNAALPDLLDGAVRLLQGIIDAVPIVIEKLLQALPNLILSVIDFLTGAKSQLMNSAAKMFGGIAEAIPKVVRSVTSNLPQIIDALVTGLTDAFPQILDAAITLFMAIVDAIPEVVVALAGSMPEIIKAIAEGITGAVPKLFSCAKNLLWQIVKAVPDIATGLAEAVPAIIQALISGLVDKAFAIAESAAEIGKAVLDGIVDFVQMLPEAVSLLLSEVQDGLSAWGEELIQSGIESASGFVGAVGEFLAELPERVGFLLGTVVGTVLKWSIDLVQAGSKAASDTVNGIISWFQQLPGNVLTWLTDTVTNVINFGIDMALKAAEAAAGFVKNIVDGVSGLPAKMVEIGANIVSGIWDGISSGWNWLTEQVSNLAGSLFEAAKSALGINSPSKVFAEEVGRWIPPGIGEGVDEAMPDLEEQIGNDMNGLAEKMRASVEIETGSITVKSGSKAQHEADTEYPRSGDTYVEEKFEQHNEYHVPVVTPSETAKANREAARKLLGGVK